MIQIRNAGHEDYADIWRILEPIVRAGESYKLPRDLDQASAIAYWCDPLHEVFVAEAEGNIVGTAFLRDNPLKQSCGVANVGYATGQAAQGRGVARALCDHTLLRAKRLGFSAMQFNYVVSTNVRAVSLWRSLGFEVIDVVPADFPHPVLGDVDAFVMYRNLDT